MSERRAAWLRAAPTGLLAPLFQGDGLPATELQEVAAGPPVPLVLAVHRLQDRPDYRGALQGWFGQVAPGGRLVIVVPHAFLFERQLSLPSPHRPGQARLYTPASLLAEVEEALEPNSYRVRSLQDEDGGYDYAASPDGAPAPPQGAEIVLVLERLASPPPWRPRVGLEPPSPGQPVAEAPDYAFEPSRTRVEREVRPAVGTILILKLDHLGDFIMSLDALERARALFPRARITLVVGSWNLELARACGLADEVVAFDVFPRNSSEAEADVAGQAGLFRQAVTGEYDLALDLRSDHDTRGLLRLVRARLRAGLGSRPQFPFLDIFLPIDATRGEPEAAREDRLSARNFIGQGSTHRTRHRILSRPDKLERQYALVWGPYRRLRPGRYIFEPELEIEPADGGVLRLDIALDAERVSDVLVQDSRDPVRLAFEVGGPQEASFEFRILTVDDLPSLEVSFFGGRLIREGGASTLHQSEYATLLVELAAMRLARTGLLAEIGGPGEDAR